MPSSQRLPWIDFGRGLAILLMIAYHFCYDLNYFGYTEFAFNTDPFWLSSRTLIVSMFLGLVGISLHLATRKGLRLQRYLRRLGLLIVFSVAITLSSKFMFPDTYIFFGILHFIALASVVGLLFLNFYWINLILGIALLIIGTQIHNPFFNQPAWQWFGLMTHKPYTEDYVPFLPWFGVVLIGIFLGKTISRTEPLQDTLARALGPSPLPAVAWLGRHSLAVYMIHQPILIGLLYLVTQVIK